MPRIYIRHARKEYKNGKSDKLIHDPPITQQGKEDCKFVADLLIKEYGHPVKIFCSPYLRTRETARIFSNIAGVPIETLVEISEYLGYRNDETLDVTKDTLEYNPPYPESTIQFRNRINYHNNNFKHYDRLGVELVWIITHGVVIKEIIKLNGNEYIHGNINYLDRYTPPTKQIGNFQGNEFPESVDYLNPTTFDIDEIKDNWKYLLNVFINELANLHHTLDANHIFIVTGPDDSTPFLKDSITGYLGVLANNFTVGRCLLKLVQMIINDNFKYLLDLLLFLKNKQFNVKDIIEIFSQLFIDYDRLLPPEGGEVQMKTTTEDVIKIIPRRMNLWTLGRIHNYIVDYPNKSL